MTDVPRSGQLSSGSPSSRPLVLVHSNSGMPGGEPTDHADAFAALSNETRVAILEALWAAEGHRASFSELRRAVEMRDSGKFNYHLDKLTDDFVVRTDDGDYRLRLAGIHVVGSLISGTYAQDEAIETVPYDEPCPLCGAETVFRYDGETFAIECTECSALGLASGPAPPSVFADADPAEVSDRAERYLHSLMDDFRSGFCLFCESPVELTVVPNEAIAPDDAVDADLAPIPILQHDCPACGESARTNLGPVLARHPAVVSFLHEHGTSVRELPLFDLTVFSAADGAVSQRDPTRAWVRYTVDGDAIEVTVDGDAAVVDVTRPSA